MSIRGCKGCVRSNDVKRYWMIMCASSVGVRYEGMLQILTQRILGV